MIDTQTIRTKILDLAMRGQLTEQLLEDGTAEDFYKTFKTQPKNYRTIMKEEILFDIPSNWKWCRFSEVADFHLGKTPSRGDSRFWESGVYPWVSISDMSEPILMKTKKKVSQSAADECFSKGISPKGTLLMSFKLTIGKVVILGVDAYHNEAIISVFPRNDNEEFVFRNYLKYILPFSAKNGRIYGAIKGNTLNKESIAELLIPLPPLAEQKRIIERVEQAFSVLDTIDALQAQYANNLTVLKSKIIDAAIQGKLTEQLPEDGAAEDLYQHIQAEKLALIKAGKIKKEKPLPEIIVDEIPFEIPVNWKWIRFSDLYSLSNGVASRGTPGGKERKVLRLADLVDGAIRSEGIREIALSDEEFSAHRIKKGDLIFIRVNGSRDKVANAFLYEENEEISYCDHLFCGHRTSELFDAYYVMTVYRSAMVKAQIDPEIKTTAGQNTINQRSMAKILVPLPPLAEQKRITQKIDELMRVFEQ